MAAKWKKHYNPKPLLDSIEKCKINNDSGEIKFQGMEIVTIPASLNSMVELGIEISEYEKYSMVQKALFECGKKGKVTKDSFFRVLNKSIAGYHQASTKKFVLLSSLAVNRTLKLKRCSIDGTVLTFPNRLPKSFRKNRQAISDFHFKSSHTGKVATQYKLVKLSTQAKSTHDAFDKCLFSLNLIRGIWNLFFNRTTPISFRSHQTPINRITLGPLHTLHLPDGRKATEEWMYEAVYRNPLTVFTPMNPSQLQNMLKFGADVRQRLKKCKYQEDMKKAIVMYCQAFDLHDWEASFIKLWGLLEFLTNTKNDSYDTTIRRVKFLYKDTEDTHQSLTYLREFRNSLVHLLKGSHGLDIFIFELKYYVERLLGYHLYNNYKFESIADACRLLDQPCDNAVLTSKLDLLNKAQEFRGKL